jgi:Chitin binding Peritrophin-A domain
VYRPRNRPVQGNLTWLWRKHVFMHYLQSVLPDDRPNIPEKVTIDCEGLTGASIPHPDSCEFYFFCAENRSYLQICGKRQKFDTISGMCQLDELATCILDESTTLPDTTTEDATSVATEAPTTEAAIDATTIELTTEDPTTIVDETTML